MLRVTISSHGYLATILLLSFMMTYPLYRMQGDALWGGKFELGTGYVSDVPPMAATDGTGSAVAVGGLAESYVISFDEARVDQFRFRNNRSGLGPILRAPAVDGHNQRNLDLWAQLLGQPALNASDFDPEDGKLKGEYKSPHAVGCYLSHWYLLQYFRHRPTELRPDLFFVFEDDSSCVPNLRERVLNVTRQLPPDWDMLFIGGKHFTQLETHQLPNATGKELTQEICAGKFGMGRSPLAPDGTRNLSVSQPYWRTLYASNTNAYVINPQRVDRVMKALKPRNYVPIDIQLGTAMSKDLVVYMPTQYFCLQPDEFPEDEWDESNGIMNEPIPWEGYFWFVADEEWRFHWEKLLLEECLGKY